MSESSSTAVVLGASIAGLLVARVLSDFYSEVTVVERDALSDQPVTRRGVPQGVMPHIPAARGMRIMDELFPKFLDELVVAGARIWNDGDLSRLCVTFNGHQFQRVRTIPDPGRLAMYFVHRPFLEWRLRRRVVALPNVEIRDGHDAVRLASTARRDRVTGVVVAHRDSGTEATLTSDLVVDATGRGSRTPVFLEQLGFRRPKESELTVHVTYAGLPVRLLTVCLDDDHGVAIRH
ncbi:FAD-dependent oxidoreductase [Mycobacterium sherrisii]|uniref:FAD-dependent oxidoreductase n=1 Tax=Mycobacterium sherrisii TaxID=243061 RepID=UPI003975E820